MGGGGGGWRIHTYWFEFQSSWFYGDVTGCTSNSEKVTSAACRIPQTDSYYGTDINTKETSSLTAASFYILPDSSDCILVGGIIFSFFFFT